ncbi:MAG: sporulation protein YqfD [Clostridia bacterium]|nr:sporulation protein YqfD [Clostridia bacterium]
MTEHTQISIVCTAEAAIKKLKKAGIGVYNCKKSGAEFLFCVKDKDLKKVFAIFSKSCYNIKVQNLGRRAGFLKGLVNRIGLVVGAFVFVVAAAVSNSFVFKINVSGSGSYLTPEVKRIIYEAGAKEFSLCTGFDAPAATGKILALPNVTFCHIQRRGSILTVDVQVDEEHTGKAELSSLVSDRAGVVRNIVAICGTARCGAGDRVNQGDALISAYTVVGEGEDEKRVDCLAAGYCELECSQSLEYAAQEESDENLQSAYAQTLLYADNILSRRHTVKQVDGGVVYVIEFTYLHKLSININ